MNGADAEILLRRALERSADAAGVDLAILSSAMTRWASATFAGARHELRCTLMQSGAADAWLIGLADAELTVRGHLVADLKIVSVAREARLCATLEVLTVADD